MTSDLNPENSNLEINYVNSALNGQRLLIKSLKTNTRKLLIIEISNFLQNPTNVKKQMNKSTTVFKRTLSYTYTQNLS